MLLVGFLSRFMPGFGPAGWAGFESPADRVHGFSGGVEECEACAAGRVAGPLVHNASVDEFTHSDAFIGTGYAERFWLPFLWDVPGAELVEFHAACGRAVTLEEEENWPELESQEKELRQRQWRLWGGAASAPLSSRGLCAPLRGVPRASPGSDAGAGRRGAVDGPGRATHLVGDNGRAGRAAEARDEREDAVLRALKPVQAVRRAVNAVFPAAPRRS